MDDPPAAFAVVTGGGPRSAPPRPTMKYLCLVYLSQENWHACEDRICADFARRLAESGRMLGGEALHATPAATTVRVRNGETLVVDGPFAETKEQLAGFYLVDATDLNDALRIAAQIPPARYGSIEVRPVRQLRTDAATGA